MGLSGGLISRERHSGLGKNVKISLETCLARYDETDRLTVDGPAEQLALWRLHGGLEKALISPFSSDYAEQLIRARGRLWEQASDP